MLFNSIVFLTFLLVVFPIYHFLSKKYQNAFLLVVSYVFYGYWDWRFCSLLLISTIVDFFVAKKMDNITDQRKRKLLLSISIITNLGILGFFKYFNFFVDSFVDSFSYFGANLDFLHINIILPIGISFYTFQTLSYTFDVYRKKMKATDSFLDFAVFVSFFPQLVAGPIEKAKDLIPQIASKPKASWNQINEGISLIAIGLFKKVLIGDTCGKFVDHIFAEPTFYTSAELFSALIMFSIQIYADFSGYSSIARGTGKLFGINLMENFNQPYLSSNITEFWKRWHISLSEWLKEYVYIWLLGGNRKGEMRTYVNLMLTMLIGGLWHGANWTFVVWGGIHGMALAIHKFLLNRKKPDVVFKYQNITHLFIFILKVLSTYSIVLIAWLFFRAENFSSAFYIFKKIVFWQESEFAYRFLSITSTYFIMIIVLDIVEYYYKRHDFLLVLKPSIRFGMIASIFLIIVVYMFTVSKPMPFVYFQF